jgi:hypothetical protein
MGAASGPATIRYITLPDVNLQFSEEHIQRAKPFLNSYCEQHTMPEGLTADVHKLNAAYAEFEEAEKAFKKAQEKLAQQRREFMNTEAGKFIENLRYPSPKLTLRDILSEETEAHIRKDAEKLGEITSWESKKNYYSRVEIVIEFKKGTEPLYGQCVEFKSHGFKCYKVKYSPNADNRIKTLTILYENGKLEAPHFRQDYVEAELHDKLWSFRKSQNEGQIVNDVFATLKKIGYNQAEYEDTIKQISEYVRVKAQEQPPVPEMTKEGAAKALLELGKGCDDDCDCDCPY